MSFEFPHPRLRRPRRQARARARRPQRADGERQGHRHHADRARRADHPGDRRQGRQGDPARAFRPAEGPRSEGIAEAGRRRRSRMSSSARSPSPTTASAKPPRRPSPRCRTATSCCWRTRASTRKRKRTIRRSSRQLAQLGDIYRQRRVLGGASRACLDRGPRAQAAGLCGPHHAGRAGGARQGARAPAAPGDRDRRRRQGLDQARTAGKPDRQGATRW